MPCSQEEGAVRLPVTVFRLISIFASLAALPDASLPVSLFQCCCLPLGPQLLLLSIPRALRGAGSNVTLAAPSRSPLGSFLLVLGLWDGNWEPGGAAGIAQASHRGCLIPAVPLLVGPLGTFNRCQSAAGSLPPSPRTDLDLRPFPEHAVVLAFQADRGFLSPHQGHFVTVSNFQSELRVRGIFCDWIPFGLKAGLQK